MKILCSRRWLLVDCFSLGGIGVYTWFASSCLLFSFLFTVTTFMGGDLISVFFASFRVTCIDFPAAYGLAASVCFFFLRYDTLGIQMERNNCIISIHKPNLWYLIIRSDESLQTLVGGRLEEPSWIGINFDIGDSSDKLTFPMLAPILFFLTHSHPLTAMNAFHAHTSLNPSVRRYAVLRHRQTSWPCPDSAVRFVWSFQIDRATVRPVFAAQVRCEWMKIEWHQSEMVSAIRDTMELLKEPQLSNSSCSHDLFYCMYFFDIGTL